MDKYDSKLDMVLDIICHPERYPSGRLNEILADPEMRHIYNLLCKTSSAVNVENNNAIDVDSEWAEFSKHHPNRGWKRFIPSNRAATTTAAFVITSLVAVAVGVAITLSVAVKQPKATVPNEPLATSSSTPAHTTDSVDVNIAINNVSPDPLIFEDAPLNNIMEEVGRIYGVKVRIINKKAAQLRLYYKLEPSLPLSEIIEQLNTFEQINIQFHDNTITVN